MSSEDEVWARLHGIWTDEWRKFAACSGKPAEWFEDPEYEAQGKAVCAVCPVRVECLDDGMYHEDYCLRGGLNEEERVSVFRHRKRYLPQFRSDISTVEELNASQMHSL